MFRACVKGTNEISTLKIFILMFGLPIPSFSTSKRLNNMYLKIFLCLFVLFMIFNCTKDNVPDIPFGGTVKMITGQATIFNKTTVTWDKLKIYSDINFGDSIKTDSESQVEIVFNNTNSIRIDENSKMVVNLIPVSKKEHTIEVFNIVGTIVSDIKKLTTTRDQYQVRTPTAVAAIRGTFFSVSFSINSKSSHINVFGGKVWVKGNKGKKKGVLLAPGQFLKVNIGKWPGSPKKMNYGQWKKMERLMKPGHFKKYSKNLKLKKRSKLKIKGLKHKKSFKGKSKKPLKGIGKMGKSFKSVFKKGPKLKAKKGNAGGKVNKKKGGKKGGKKK